jgi:2'-5' RNA ligase superfamily
LLAIQATPLRRRDFATLRSISTFGETWATFRALELTLGPTEGALEMWRRGRERYALWALRVADPVVIARMAAVADRLAGAIVPVHPDRAHVTTWVCGFPSAAPAADDDVADAIIAAQRRAVASLPCPRVVVGAPNAFATCAFLEVHDPHGDLAALRAALAVPGAKEVRFAPYLPHVTIGRFGDTRPAAPLARALAMLRDGEHSARVAIADSTIALIELDARTPDRLTTVWTCQRANSGDVDSTPSIADACGA